MVELLMERTGDELLVVRGDVVVGGRGVPLEGVLLGLDLREVAAAAAAAAAAMLEFSMA